jgi:hypothetical protein
LHKAKAWSLNLDGNYAATDDVSFGVFYTLEDQRSQTAGNNIGTNNDGLQTAAGAVGNSGVGQVNGTGLSGSSSCNSYTTVAQRNQNAKIDPCINWTADMHDRTHTLGAAFKVKNLLSGKLDLAGDVTWSKADTDVGFLNGGTYANNPLSISGATSVTIGAFYIPATAMPTVTTDTITLKLGGKYQINKASAFRAGYLYQRMKAVDYIYDALQVGGTPTSILPTNEQAPVYKVQAVSFSYVYTFQ